jgi:hypothetical protein
MVAFVDSSTGMLSEHSRYLIPKGRRRKGQGTLDKELRGKIRLELLRRAAEAAA